MEGRLLLLLGVVVLTAIALGFDCRRVARRRKSFTTRPSVPDDEFLLVVRDDEADAPLWLAVRGAVAGARRVPPAAIHPGDRLDDIWKCLWDGLDYLDLIFRLERGLGMKIPREKLEPVWRERPEHFDSFAKAVVEVLRENWRRSTSGTPPPDGP